MKPEKFSAEALADNAKWLDRLRHFNGVEPEKVPPGWFTVQQIAKRWGISRGSAGRRLQQIAKRGLAARKMFRIATGPDGSMVFPIPHYGPPK